MEEEKSKDSPDCPVIYQTNGNPNSAPSPPLDDIPENINEANIETKLEGIYTESKSDNSIPAKADKEQLNEFFTVIDAADNISAELQKEYEATASSMDKSNNEKAAKSCSDLIEANVSPTAKSVDSLILTADEELEISFVQKEGNNNNGDADVHKCTAGSAIKIADTKSEVEINIKEDINETGEAAKVTLLSSDENMNKEKVSENAANKVNVGSSRILWVYNITQSVRASDLKQYVSKAGKVITAKIVTDGKKCYGYIIVDNSEDAAKCLKSLNNTYFEGRKLTFSFLRPQRSNPEKKEDKSKSSGGSKSRSSKKEADVNNDTDEAKMKSKSSNKTNNNEQKRKPRSCSRSSRISKCRRSNDPLTTRFDFKRARSSRRRSRSNSRINRNEYLHEREERDRFRRRLLEEERRNHNEMLRQREEKNREMAFRLEQERRKLQLERELFEKERRELTRFDLERRKIERERLEVLEQRTKLQEELQNTRIKTKADEFSILGKSQSENNGYDKRKETPIGFSDDFRKSLNSKTLFQKPIKNDRSSDSKNSASNSRSVQKSDHMEFQPAKDSGKKLFHERSVPPAPKLSIGDFDLSIGRKGKHSDRKHDYSDPKPLLYCDRKSERGGRRIEVIDRKFYPERSEIPERKHERMFRKSEFEDRKPHVFAERKYEYGRDAKRFRDESFSERDPIERTQWPAASVNNYNEQWKSVPSGPLSAGTSGVRYQEANFSASPYAGPSRIPPFYYHPSAPSTGQEFQRYDHCSQVNSRKYN